MIGTRIAEDRTRMSPMVRRTTGVTWMALKLTKVAREGSSMRGAGVPIGMMIGERFLRILGLEEFEIGQLHFATITFVPFDILSIGCRSNEGPSTFYLVGATETIKRNSEAGSPGP